MVAVQLVAVLFSAPTSAAIPAPPAGCAGGPAGTPAAGSCEKYNIKKALVEKICEGQPATCQDTEFVKTENDTKTNEIYTECSGASYATDAEKLKCILDDINSSRGYTTPLVKSAISSSPDKLSGVLKTLQDVITGLSILIGAALAGSTIFAGVQYISSAGDPGKAQKAMARIASNIVVIAVFVSLAVLLNWIIPG